MNMDEKLIFENIEVITTLEKWKVLPLKEIGRIMDAKVKPGAIYKRFTALQTKGVVQKIRIRTSDGKSIMAITLSEKVKKFRGHDYEGDHFLHDLMVSSIASVIQTLPGLIDIFFEHETFKSQDEDQFSSNKFHPDAMAVLDLGRKKASFIAIEVEKSRKSITRIQNKLSEYGQSDKVDLVTYFFNDPLLMEVYLRALNGIDSDKVRTLAQKKVAFIYISDFLKAGEQLMSSDAIFNNTKTNFREILNNL